MNDRSYPSYRRIVSLVTVLVSAFALAIPAGAQVAEQPGSQPGEREPGNPAANCLPDEAHDGEDAGENGEDAGENGEDPREVETQTARPAQEEDADNGDDVRQDEVAQCIVESLPDIVGSAHAASIVAVVSERIAQGYPDGTFRAQNAVTREQMASFLTRALDLDVPEEGVAEIPDVDEGNPHADAVAAVVDAAIALGQPDGTFRPGEPVTRGQMASFLTRALALAQEAGEIPDDARGTVHERAIGAVMDAGIAQGYDDGRFGPQDAVTRGQMASFLARGLDL